MEYSELSQLWEVTGNSDLKISLNQKAINEMTTNKLKSSLAEIRWSSVVEIIITFIWLVFLGNFTIENYQSPLFNISGIILIVISIFSLTLEIHKLNLYYSINNNFTVFRAQKKIERLRLMEKIDINSLYFFIPLFFVPFTLVITKGFLNIDLLQLGFGRYEILLLTFGSAIIATLMVFALRKHHFKSINESLEFLKDINTKNK